MGFFHHESDEAAAHNAVSSLSPFSLNPYIDKADHRIASI